MLPEEGDAMTWTTMKKGRFLLVLGAALGLAGCYDGYGYGGVSVGTGIGYGYDDPYHGYPYRGYGYGFGFGFPTVSGDA